MKRYGLVGHPVSHSASPALHNWGFARHGLAAVYEAWDVSPENLPDWVRAMRAEPLRGASVTIPHKEAVIPLLDGLAPAARRAGAVNTLFWQDGALLGENTDVLGCARVLEGLSPGAALILGAGGVARAILAGLEQAGLRDVTVAARSPDRAAPLVRDFGCRLVPWEERTAVLAALCRGLVVNATPLGMRGPWQEQSPLAPDHWPATGGCAACDTVYAPPETLFLRQARARGWRAVDGMAF
ncbi:MAG: shikimate dehydrogenase, partial [Desulfovibrio sp.]|nr:shikimate dehydrogenase [Desulfovibrio sp.]